SWESAGAVRTPARATKIWKAILAEFEPPAQAPDRLEARDDFVARRVQEGGAPTDF
ncbi:MAG: trimethylamine methyltransferase family protein, partial [Pseudomonadota bacterium]